MTVDSTIVFVTCVERNPVLRERVLAAASFEAPVVVAWDEGFLVWISA